MNLRMEKIDTISNNELIEKFMLTFLNRSTVILLL